ncbi:MAG: twin-arginine translocase subunit TatC [Acidobacteriota bacterium]|nr:twin-arginine translocase subunit TatC [Acidobacteriota bacterium]
MTKADPNEMSFFEHLEELRGRIFKSLILWVVVFCVCFFFHKEIFEFLATPYKNLGENHGFTMIDPKEPFLAHIRACFWVSIILSSGLIFYHIWMFVSPGLTKSEKWFALPFLIFMSLFFILGCLFSFVQVFPTALDYLISYNYGGSQNLVTRSYYLSILFAFVMGMGASFELPLVIFFLAKVGVVTPRFLLQKFKYAVLIVFTISAIITPTPDPYIQTFLAVPMLLLYLLGVGAAALVAKKKKEEDEEEALSLASETVPVDEEVR